MLCYTAACLLTIQDSSWLDTVKPLFFEDETPFRFDEQQNCLVSQI